jgi:DNA-binding response OmpR family regulator
MPAYRLLLIEDDFDVAEMLIMYFQALQYEVLHADTGAAGIEIARTRFPNLILLDVMLPDMDGYDVCVNLRRRALTKYIPTLFLTQIDERSSKVKGLTLGADDYITKPFDIDELRLRVENAIKRARRENLNEPRTGLPTGELVEEERRRRQGTTFHELLMSIEHFSAYAEVYSFMAASEVLYHAGQVIRDVLAEAGAKDDFVGITDDEFVILTSVTDLAPLQAQIEQRFDTQVKAFYNFIDADKGGVTLHPGTSQERFVPLMRLTRSEPIQK